MSVYQRAEKEKLPPPVQLGRLIGESRAEHRDVWLTMAYLIPPARLAILLPARQKVRFANRGTQVRCATYPRVRNYRLMQSTVLRITEQVSMKLIISSAWNLEDQTIFPISGPNLLVLRQVSIKKTRSRITCMIRYVREPFLCNKHRSRSQRIGWLSIIKCLNKGDQRIEASLTQLCG